jgi:hypothetical protein
MGKRSSFIAFLADKVEVSATPDRLITAIGQALDSETTMIARLTRIEGDLARRGLTMTFQASGHVVFGRPWGGRRK